MLLLEVSSIAGLLSLVGQPIDGIVKLRILCQGRQVRSEDCQYLFARC